MSRLILLSLSYTLTRACLPWLLRLMAMKGLTSSNYLGHALPAPAGLVPVGVSLALMAGTTVWLDLAGGWLVFFFSFVVALLGLLDDLKGELLPKGFRGHFAALQQGRITTGFMKAAGGFILSLAAAWELSSHQFTAVVINTLVIALMTNFLNLMDLRPGRAAKTFIACSALLVLAAPHTSPAWLFIILGAALAYLPSDLQMKSMLGDTGANFWGFILGLAVVSLFSTTVKAIIVLLLLGVHIYAEGYSISQLIEKTPWLNYLDRLGRPDY